MGYYTIGIPNYKPSAADLKQRAEDQKQADAVAKATKQPGTAFVVDQFNSQGDAHGDHVADTIKSEGFKGNIVKKDLDDDFIVLSPEASKAESTVKQKGASPGQFVSALNTTNDEHNTDFLNEVTSSLKEIDQGGAHNSAVNISQGSSKADDAMREYKQITQSLSPDYHPSDPAQAQGDKNMLDNACRAFHVNESELKGQDQEKSGAQRAKLQQALIDQVNGEGAGNTQLQKAKSSYDKEVDHLAGKHVAVDVAAGNAGDTLNQFAKDDGPKAQALHAPPGFYDNVLSNGQTHTVGAVGEYERDKQDNLVHKGNGDLIPQKNPTTVASYSSPDSHVIGYAGGFTPDQGEDGTSFASPRHTAADSTILGRTNLSVDQANKVVQQKLTKTVPNDGHPVQELDDDKLRAYTGSSQPLPS